MLFYDILTSQQDVIKTTANGFVPFKSFSMCVPEDITNGTLQKNGAFINVISNTYAAPAMTSRKYVV